MSAKWRSPQRAAKPSSTRVSSTRRAAARLSPVR
ncbi:Uncharacterised protein [Bordetella pertussis]|nr:Uncharacterised protein [Bordetella pertussis]